MEKLGKVGALEEKYCIGSYFLMGMTIHNPNQTLLLSRTLDSKPVHSRSGIFWLPDTGCRMIGGLKRKALFLFKIQL